MNQICAHEECRAPFEAKRVDARYCSDNCRSRARKASSSAYQRTLAPFRIPKSPAVAAGSSTPSSPPAQTLDVLPDPKQQAALPAGLTPQLAEWLQRADARLSTLERTRVDEPSLATVHQLLLKAEERLDTLQAKTLEQSTSDPSAPVWSQVEALTCGHRTLEGNFRSHSEATARLAERLRVLEQHPCLRVDVQEWFGVLTRRVQSLEQAPAAPKPPPLPEWLPEVPARLRQLELKAKGPSQLPLPPWMDELPRKLKSLEERLATLAANGSSQLTDPGLGGRVRGIDHRLSAVEQVLETLEAPKRLALLERRLSRMPADTPREMDGLHTRVGQLETSVEALEQSTTEVRDAFALLVHHLNGDEAENSDWEQNESEDSDWQVDEDD